MTTLAPASTPEAKPPLVAVIGTTGVGKTDLSVELAKAVRARERAPKRAEVLNHDSMQCYRGLDVITNKATDEEMQGVPHHLMGFLEPGEEWSVNDFLAGAFDKIRELQQRDALPITVGGTTYYLQNLVFPNQLVADVPARPASPSTPSPSPAPVSASRTLADTSHFPPSLRETITSLPPELLALFLALPSLPQISSPSSFPPSFPLDRVPPRLRAPETLVPALYALLQAVDPQSAQRWHWRDVRKVRRALDVVWEGRRWEDVVQEQKARPNEGPRFRTLIFWLYAENDSLHPRLDKRVDKMIERGLLSEINELWQIAHAPGASPIDYSKGIYQAIGYKEFEDFLARRHRHPDLSLESDPELRKLFDQGVEATQTSTRQYAKRQVKWIKGKLLPAVRDSAEGETTVVLLDASDLSRWRDSVLDPAVSILDAFLDGEPLPDPASLSPVAAQHLAPPSAASASHAKRPCPSCTRDPSQPFLVEERQWDAHLQSKTHRMALRNRAKREGRARPADGGTAAKPESGEDER